MRLRRASGFTLIELLIAIGIFAIVSSIAYGGLNQVLRARDRIEAEREFWRTLSLVFLRMQDDFSQAAPRPIRNTLGTSDPAFIGQPTDIRALGAPSVEFTRGGILVFDLKSDDEEDDPDTKPPPPRSDLERIGYRYSEGVLYRLSWPVLDRAPTTEPTQTELLRDVEEFEVKFFNPNATSDFNQWFPTWPQLAAGSVPASPADTSLPRGVKVELKLKGRDEITRLFVIGG